MAGQIIINGTAFPIRQEIAFDYDPQNGYVFKQKYAGAGYAEMLGLANQFAAAGIRYDFSYRAGIAHLSTEDTSAQVTIDTWTVAQNENSKSALENPLIIAGMAAEGGTAEQQLNRRIDIAKVQTGEMEYDTLSKEFEDRDLTFSLRLLQQIKLGSTDYAMSGYVLRHCTNVGNRFASNVSDINTDAIYTTSLMLSETTNSFSWIYPLPGRLQYKLQAISNDFISRYGTHEGYLWGWLKRGSTEGTAANNRINIVTEYWFDEWSTDRYSYAF